MADIFAAAVARLSSDELRALWQAQIDGRLDDDRPPRERLAAWCRRQSRDRFMRRAAGLPLSLLAQVHARLLAGEDADAILAELPPIEPAPDGAGHPDEGHHGNRHRS
jgi:hypothetical protein